MFGFSKKVTLKNSGVFQELIDCHTHLLPGVDDGVKTTEESLRILDIFQSMGVKKVILTPHIMEDYPLNDKEYLTGRFDAFQKAYTGNIELALGAEYMLDNCFERHLNSNSLLTIGEKEVLVETSYMYEPMNFWELLNRIHSCGYYIVLAHPERYTYFQIDDYYKLKLLNVRFQLNLLSLTGHYGRRAEYYAHKLLKMEYYDCIGSDIHESCRFQQEIAGHKLPIDTLHNVKRINDSI